MRSLSLTMRQALTGQSTDEVPVVLATITHPDLVEPVRLSSDPTVQLSVEPLRYGTISGGQTYLFVLMRAAWPDDQEGAPPASQLILENVDADMVKVIRSMSGPARVRLQIVLASSPDYVEAEFDGLLTTDIPYDANQISISISRNRWSSEPWPCDRMTKDRFPGVH